MGKSSSWKANSRSASQEFPTFYGTRRFITMFAIARHWSAPWCKWIQSTPYHLPYLIFILILSSNVWRGLSSRLFPSCFSTEIFYIFLISPMCAMNRTLLDLITLITTALWMEDYWLNKINVVQGLSYIIKMGFSTQNHITLNFNQYFELCRYFLMNMDIGQLYTAGEISGSHDDEYVDGCLPVCSIVWSCRYWSF
jgi:hypothetical protein